MITVILPTYNERENIEDMVRKIARAGFKILIVDDSSPDGTGELADKLVKKYKTVSVIHRDGKKGLGSAIVEGMAASHTDIVGVMDADMSHDPSILPGISERFGAGADFVIGSRYVKGGGIGDWPFYRKLTSLVATLMVRPIAGVKDPVSGYFFVRKSVIKGVKLNPESCKICLDILVRGNYNSVAEVPYVFCDRRRGSTKILNLREVMRYVKYVAYLYFYKIMKLNNRVKDE
ncbi:MAG: polyprenol monophosphomannose synthase [Candidatus Aenigmarchaeota archaeon]|nr:polyprenol monophosphomannose synthase [Candidatus Aenigmarchaeota archaeon]